MTAHSHLDLQRVLNIICKVFELLNGFSYSHRYWMNLILIFASAQAGFSSEKKDPFFVSVIIDNHNHAQYVLEAVDSVLAQSRPADEIIVIDDGSTDTSPQLLKSNYGKIQKVKLIFQSNQGQGEAFNRAYAESKGDLILFLDADDTIKSSYLEKAIQVFKENPEVQFISCNTEIVRDGNTLKKTKFKDGYRAYYNISALVRWPKFALLGNLVYRRGLLDSVFPLPSFLLLHTKVHGDAPIIIGSCLLGGKTHGLKDDFFNYRRHSSNHSAQYHKKELCFNNELTNKRIIEYYRKKAFLPKNSAILALLEYGLNEDPTHNDYISYYRSIQSDNTQLAKDKRILLAELKKIYTQKHSRSAPITEFDTSPAPPPLWLSGK